MIRNYSHADYSMLCAWLAHHGIANPDPNFFSDTGIVVDEKAIGFLFTTNSKSCYIDHVAASPHAKKEERDVALDGLFETLEGMARVRGFEVITGLARIRAMTERFTNHNFLPFNTYTLFYKKLGGDSCLG